MQEKYRPSDVETAAQAHWNATRAYLAVEHAKDAQGAKGKRASPLYPPKFRSASGVWLS